MSRARARIFVGVLAAAFFLQSYSASRIKSPVFDEPGHIAAAVSYVESGRIVVSPEHPPLLREISGIFLHAGGVTWPASRNAAALMAGDLRLATLVGIEILENNGPDRVLAWGRLPFIALATALAVILYLFGRDLLGDGAAVGAVFIYAFDPNILAHSFPVTTDTGITVFTVVFLWTLWRYVRSPTAGRAIVAGLALGAALGAKFTAVALVPSAAILLLIDAFRRKPSHGNRAKRETLVWRHAAAFAGMCAVAFSLLQAIYLFPGNPLQYLDGMRTVNANHDPTVFAYMHGELAPRFYSYYVVAYLLKEPLASMRLPLSASPRSRCPFESCRLTGLGLDRVDRPEKNRRRLLECSPSHFSSSR